MDTEIRKRKQKAIEYFTQKLLASRTGKNVGRIILFGSVVKGEADAASDIDLMIFAKNPEKVENYASNLSYDILLEQGESIESHVYPVSEFAKPTTYFVKLAQKTGQSIYARK